MHKNIRHDMARRLLCGLLASLASAAVHAQGACGGFENNFGPFDYYAHPDKHSIVERFHFTPDVENLIRGSSNAHPGGDIAYTLRAFPNHPRALNAMARLSTKESRAQPQGSTYTVDCWIERGMRFRPKDAMVPMLYGLHLLRVNRTSEALKYLESARNSGIQDANLHYNLGLAYVKLKRYDEAMTEARKAYAMGFPLPGLRNQLQRAGKWRD